MSEITKESDLCKPRESVKYFMAYTILCKKKKKKKSKQGAKMSKSKNFFRLNLSNILAVNLMDILLPSKVVLNVMK